MTRRPEDLRDHETQLDCLLKGMGDELAARFERSRKRTLQVRMAATAGVILVVVAVASFAGQLPRRQLIEAPTFTAFTLAPVLTNRGEALDALERNYPDELRQASVEGTTMVYLFISESGSVENAVVGEPSGQELLDQAAINVARAMRFTAAIHGDAATEAWIQIPISFSLDDSPCARCRGIGAAGPLPADP